MGSRTFMIILAVLSPTLAAQTRTSLHCPSRAASDPRAESDSAAVVKTGENAVVLDRC